jgi:hypothetical protein
MWILKNSKELLEGLKSRGFSQIHSIKTYDFFKLYTTITHNKLKYSLFKVVDNWFFFKNKNGTQKYKFIVLGNKILIW